MHLYILTAKCQSRAREREREREREYVNVYIFESSNDQLHFKVPQVRPELGKRGFGYIATLSWNNLQSILNLTMLLTRCVFYPLVNCCCVPFRRELYTASSFEGRFGNASSVTGYLKHDYKHPMHLTLAGGCL